MASGDLSSLKTTSSSSSQDYDDHFTLADSSASLPRVASPPPPPSLRSPSAAPTPPLIAPTHSRSASRSHSGSAGHRSPSGHHTLSVPPSSAVPVATSVEAATNAMEQLEYYRDHYFAAIKQLEQSGQESAAMRTKYTDISNENVRLQQRTHHLEKKLARCMDSLKLSAAVADAGGAQHQQHHPQVPCAFVAECAEWKQKFDALRSDADTLRAEAERYQKHCDDLSRDRNSLALEKDELKQQMAAAKSMYHVDIKVMQSRADELRRVTAQRNAAEHELRTILAERKGVLEENQKLADDVAAAREQLAEHDKRCAYDAEALRRELDAERRYRDERRAECAALRDQLAASTADGKDSAAAADKELADEQEKLRKQLERALAECAKAVAETEVAKSRRDWAISEREKIVLERDSVKYLCDELRKERDTAISELLAAIRDSEKIKKQKDEACREVEFVREQLETAAAQHGQLQMVQQQLREQQAVATAAAASAGLGQSGRRSTARWSCAGAFEQGLELAMARGAAGAADMEVVELDMSGDHEPDSADAHATDTNDDDTDDDELDDSDDPTTDDHRHRRRLQRHNRDHHFDHDFGITLEGGRSDSDSARSDLGGGVFVVSVAPTSPAYGRLRPNDCIVQINQLDCTGASKRTVLETLRATAAAPSCCRVVVRRPRVAAAVATTVASSSSHQQRSHMYAVQLNLAGGSRNHGIQLETGVYIARIAPGSLAARGGCELAAGDRVLSVNSRSMEGVRSAKEAMLLLDDNRPDALTIISLKQVVAQPVAAVAVATPMAASSSGVGGQQRLAKHGKMTNSCTQTEAAAAGNWTLSGQSAGPSNMSASLGADAAGTAESSASGQRPFAVATQNSKSTSKISEMINKFKGKMHMPGSSSSSSASAANKQQQQQQLQLAAAAGQQRGGASASDADSLYLENDALQQLDSVLNMEGSQSTGTATVSGKSKDNLFKRSKRSSKKDSGTKEANKNLGTWPRANILLSSSSAASSAGSEGHHHAGTIVQHRKKERPALSFFTGPLNLGLGRGSEAASTSEAKPSSGSQQAALSVAPSASTGASGSVQPSSLLATDGSQPNYFQPLSVQHTAAAAAAAASAATAASKPVATSGRQSNPLAAFVAPPPPPPSIVNRHSVYSTGSELLEQQLHSHRAPPMAPQQQQQQLSNTLSRTQKTHGVYHQQQQPHYQHQYHASSSASASAGATGFHHPAHNPNRLSLNIPTAHAAAALADGNSAHHLYNTLNAQHSSKSPPPIPLHKSQQHQQQQHQGPPPQLPAKSSHDHFKSSVDSFGLPAPLSLMPKNGGGGGGVVSSMDFKRLSMTSPQHQQQQHGVVGHHHHSSSSGGMHPALQQQQHHHHHHHHQMSGGPASAGSMAPSPMKSQNSIDSFLSGAGGKSPIDVPPKLSQQASRDSFDVFGSPAVSSAGVGAGQRISRNSAKYPSDSDSLSMLDVVNNGGGSSGGGSGTHSRISRTPGLPAHHRVAPIGAYPPASLAFGPGSVAGGQYHPAHSAIRQSSPLTLSTAQQQLQQHQQQQQQQLQQHHQQSSSTDKLEFEYHHHHQAGASMDVADMYGSAGASVASPTSSGAGRPQGSKTMMMMMMSAAASASAAAAAGAAAPPGSRDPYYHHHHASGGGGGGGGGGGHGHGHGYEGGTFPRKKENQRFRIPSNPSVAGHHGKGGAAGGMGGGHSAMGHSGGGVKNSTGSIEQHGGGSERNSPMPPAFQVEVLSHGANKRNSMPDYCYGQKPSPGDLRRVTIDKSVELGITITCNTGGGIFVSTVAENSIASQVGLQIGDQLLEVCGINMRNATYELAANVLRQCGNSITMLVQYSPEKFDRNARPPRSSEDDIVSRSGSPTPRNSPRTARAILMGMHVDSHSSSSSHHHQHHHQSAASAAGAAGAGVGLSATMKPTMQPTVLSTSGSQSTAGILSQNKMMQQSGGGGGGGGGVGGVHPSSPPTLLTSTSLLMPNSRPASVISTSQHSMLVSTGGGAKPGGVNKYADSLEQQSVSESSATDLSAAGSPTVGSSQVVGGSGIGGLGPGGNNGGSEPRLLTMTTKKNTNLGISLMGGNAVGIYVHDVQKNSLADAAGMRMGDQILEYNGADLRRVTAEQAANEISRPAEKVAIVVQHNLKKFNQIKDEAGDSLYIRVGFDRTGDLGEGELRFAKDDVLYVDTTIFRGVFGQWRAWKLDEYGHRLECGIIPSQLKVEEELRLLSDITGDASGDGTARRGSTSARRSFFRRKKHPRSSSRDSKEVASFSNTQLSWFSDSGMLSEEGTMLSYQRVERLDYSVCRPVLIIGPLADCVADKLSIDFPLVFERCLQTPMNCTPDAMEKGMLDNIFVDYRKRSSIFECTTVQAIRDIGDRNHHCILDVCISAVERLQRLQIYPIVLLMRFKSAKQIKEIKDSRYSTDKISAKAAKEMYEHTLKLESDYRQYISAVIPAGVNITHMSTQIKAAVDEEQTKVLWVPLATGH